MKTTSNYIANNNVCKHPVEFASECIYCDGKIEDKLKLHPNSDLIKGKFINWLKAYLEFNGVSSDKMVEAMDKMIVLCINYPVCFAGVLNPNVRDFLKSVESIGITTEDEADYEDKMREVIA